MARTDISPDSAAPRRDAVHSARGMTLAEMIGTTRSRVSFFMNKFRKLGFIDYNGSLEVHSSLLNMVLHEAPGITKSSERRMIGG